MRILIELVVLAIGGILAIIFPSIVVPTALGIALLAWLANIFIKPAKPKKLPPPGDPVVHGRPLLPANPGWPLGQIPLPSNVAVTYRTVLLLLFGGIPLMLFTSHDAAMMWLASYNLMIGVLVFLDFHLAVRPEQIRCRRHLPGKLSIGVPNTVSLIVENFSFRRVTLDIRDEYPPEFKCSASDPILSVTIQRRSRATLTYQVEPEARGVYRFGQLSMRYPGPMDLAVRQRDVSLEDLAEVYPNITSISRLDLRLRRSHLLETGLISERKRGSGTDFESLREYVFGDEFRKIDWKATARRNQMITREYQMEVNQSIVVVLDRGRAMGTRAGSLTLLDHAVNAALLLGYQVTHRGDKIGLLIYSNEVETFVPPAKGKKHYHAFLRALAQVKPAQVESDVTATCRFLMGRRLRRSLLMMLTDLGAGSSAEVLCRELIPTMRKHVPTVVSLVNPVTLAKVRQVPNDAAQLAEKVLARSIIDRTKETLRLLEKRGVIALALGPEELTPAVLSAYLRVKLRDRL